MSMPSDTIASLCVLHLVKQLYKEFVDDMHKEAERSSQTEKHVNSITSNQVKIQAIYLFDDLGKLFDKELKQRLMDKKKSKNK